MSDKTPHSPVLYSYDLAREGSSDYSVEVFAHRDENGGIVIDRVKQYPPSNASKE